MHEIDISTGRDDFDSQVNEKRLCKHYELVEKQIKAYKQYKAKGFIPLSGEIKKWRTKESKILCRVKHDYIAYISLEKLTYNLFPKSIPQIALENLRVLGKKVGLELISNEFTTSSALYLFLKENKYKVYAKIGNINKVLAGKCNLENSFRPFLLKNNPCIIENLSIYLKAYEANIINDTIQTIDVHEYVDFTTREGYVGRLLLKPNFYKKGLPNVFDTRNPYFLSNLKIALKLKGWDYVILDEKVEDRNRIVAQDSNGMKVILKSDEIQRKDRDSKPLIFHSRNPYTIENIIRFCQKKRPEYEVLSMEYISAKKDLRWKYIGQDELFSNADRKFTMSWDNFRKGERPKIFTRSRAEQILTEELTAMNINFKNEIKLEGCKKETYLPFDIVIFKSIEVNDKKILKNGDFCNIALIIEYQGKHHFEPIRGELEFELIKDRDKIKADFCQEHNIPFETMNQTKYEFIPQQLVRMLKKYSIIQ